MCSGLGRSLTRALCIAIAVVWISRASSAQTARGETWPTLEQVVSLARERGVGAVEATGQIAVARAARTGAGLSILGNPYIEAYADRGRATRDVYVQGQLFLPLDLMGQRGARIDEANRLREWREWGLVNAQSMAAGEAVAAYGQALVASSRLSEAHRAEEAAKREAQYFTSRLQAQDTTVYYTSLATAEVARWIQTRVEAQLGLAQALSRLIQATGALETGTPPPNAATLPPPLKGNWDAAQIGTILERSPIVRSVRAEQTYWSAFLDRAEAEKYAPFSLMLTGGRGDLGETRFGAGFGWAFPVTRRNQGEVARAEAERARATQVEASYRRILEARLVTAVGMYKEIRQTIDVLDQMGIPAAERAAESVNEAFRLGKAELVQVLIARRDLATARFRRLDLIELAWRAYGDLSAIQGGLP